MEWKYEPGYRKASSAALRFLPCSCPGKSLRSLIHTGENSSKRCHARHLNPTNTKGKE
jgi:hypothetical protein